MFTKLTKYLRYEHPVNYYPGLLIILFILTKIQIQEVNPKLSDVFLFLLFNIAIYVITFALLNYFIRNRFKSCLIIFLFLAFTLFYHKIKEAFQNLSIPDAFLKLLSADDKTRSIILSIVLVLLIIGISVLIIRFQRPLVKISKYLNLLMIFLIVYQSYTIIAQNTEKIKLSAVPELKSKATIDNIDRLPDIYYIILDGYTSNKSLKDYWDFDNDAFSDFLTKKGFWVASGSLANYNMTPYSLASSLNMSYLKSLPKTLPTNAQKKNLFDLVYDNSICKILAEYGYQIINYSFFDIRQCPKYYNDFFFLLREKMTGGTLYELALEKLSKKWAAAQHSGIYTLKDINLDILDKINKSKKNPGKPCFVYAHVMMPHDPYFFDSDGKIDTSESVLDPLQKDRYLNQLKYLNSLVENSISGIIKNYSDNLPVIIIQADHGWRYLRGKNRKKESSTILNAYLFPDHDYSKLYHSISPVNSFRIVLNKYLNFNLPVLSDSTNNVFVFKSS